MKQTIRHIFGSTFTVATIFLAAGCSEYNPEEFNGNLTKEEYEKISEYTQNFTLRYGKMDPDHDWGFGELAPKGSKGAVSKSGKSTRLGAFTNTNEWIVFSKRNDGQGDYIYDYKLNEGIGMDGMSVPGFPSSVNGWYYTEEGIFKSKEEMLAYLKENNKYAIQPKGDVTDEEIIYVSNWFRTHPNPASEKVDLGAFFIQNISSDCDRVSYPNGAKKTLDGKSLDFYMNELKAIQTSGSKVHTNNFNSQNSGPIPEVLPATEAELYDALPSDYDYTGIGQLPYTQNRIIQCMRTINNEWYHGDDESRVNSFECHSSNDNTWNENYVLVYLDFVGPKSGKHYKGYYLGFDYSYDKDGQKIEADGYYSNWIVKVAYAYAEEDPQQAPDPEITTTESRRVMCEDLGNTNDFDFNDLVFDVYYTYKKDAAGNKTDIKAHITLQAVGGTLPIYIGAQTTSDPTKELHYLMTHTNAKNPINVGAGTTCAPVTFMMSAATTDPNGLDICVGSHKATDHIILPKSGNSSLAPQKICVPTTVRWLRESQQIERGYTKFKEWVNNRQTQSSFWNDGIDQTYLF